MNIARIGRVPRIPVISLEGMGAICRGRLRAYRTETFAARDCGVAVTTPSRMGLI